MRSTQGHSKDWGQPWHLTTSTQSSGQTSLELFLVCGKAKKINIDAKKTFKRKYEEVPFSFQNPK